MSQNNNFSQRPVPQSVRKRVLALTFTMLGLTFFLASMRTGGTFGTGLSYRDSFFVVLIGNLPPDIYTSSLGHIGTKAGLTTHLLACFPFNVKDSRLSSLLLGGTQVGWFNVGVAIFAIPVGKVTGLDINLLIAVSGLLVTVTVFLDISALMVPSVIAVPVITCLDGYSVQLTVSGMDGLDALKAVIPAQPLDFDVALALVVRSFIGTGTLTAGFVRFGHDAELTVLVAMAAFFLGDPLTLIFGAAGVVALGMADISDVTTAQGLLLPTIVVLGLNVWITNDNTFYASGLGFANITGMSSETLSAINGIIGIVCASWLCDNFIDRLIFLSAAIPSVDGMIIADYLMNHHRCEHFATMRTTGVNWAAILAVALGITADHQPPGITPVSAVLDDTLSYPILNPTLNRKTTAAMTHVETNNVR